MFLLTSSFPLLIAEGIQRVILNFLIKLRRGLESVQLAVNLVEQSEDDTPGVILGKCSDFCGSKIGVPGWQRDRPDRGMLVPFSPVLWSRSGGGTKFSTVFPQPQLYKGVLGS